MGEPGRLQSMGLQRVRHNWATSFSLLLKLGKEYDNAVCYHLVYLTYIQSTSGEMLAGWITSWNQDCQEKYQQPQICRWHSCNGRKWRGTKEPLNEDERGEWKSWLKTQHSKNEDHGIWSHHFTANGWEKKVEAVTDFIFLGSKITLDGECLKLKGACSLEEKLWQTETAY